VTGDARRCVCEHAATDPPPAVREGAEG